jgi:hypothetical protein
MRSPEPNRQVLPFRDSYAVAEAARDIAQLCTRRWKIKLWFRDVETSRGMEVLRCKSPGMLHKELEMLFIAYDLIRCLMVSASTLKRYSACSCKWSRSSRQPIVRCHPHLAYSPALDIVRDSGGHPWATGGYVCNGPQCDRKGGRVCSKQKIAKQVCSNGWIPAYQYEKTYPPPGGTTSYGRWGRLKSGAIAFARAAWLEASALSASFGDEVC